MLGAFCAALTVNVAGAGFPYGPRRAAHRITPTRFGGASLAALTDRGNIVSRTTENQLTQTFSFTLHLADVSDLTPEIQDRLFSAGCDDALLGLCDGTAYLDFNREATSREAAVSSALADVQRAGFMATLEG
jgi:hypothetical protein